MQIRVWATVCKLASIRWWIIGTSAERGWFSTVLRRVISLGILSVRWFVHFFVCSWNYLSFDCPIYSFRLLSTNHLKGSLSSSFRTYVLLYMQVLRICSSIPVFHRLFFMSRWVFSSVLFSACGLSEAAPLTSLIVPIKNNTPKKVPAFVSALRSQEDLPRSFPLNWGM
jgi:hypothetical protein